jgi:hypothetical protein
VTGELLRLLDGFYSNTEDGLFELAYRAGEEGQRRRCFDLMRELRLRRAGLVKNFARAMDGLGERWHGGASYEPDVEIGSGFEVLAVRMAEKSTAHFAGVLNAIAERAEVAGTRRFDATADLPISPRQIALAFVRSCRSLRFDEASIEIVQQLFSRFVLDCLGSAYGTCNIQLQEAGYLIARESGRVSNAS